MHQADLDYQQRIAELGLDGLKVDAADRDSARKREIAVKDKVPAVLSAIAVIGFFGVLAALFFVTIPEKNAEVIFMMIGSGVVGAFTIVLNYYFGSSSGSRLKTLALADSAKDKP
ncbi:MAG: hypothetical protein IPK75_20050 [Acidobacteria bacterium]|nr:hypothetical protein [Acidobacteriota bacterium]